MIFKVTISMKSYEVTSIEEVKELELPVIKDSVYTLYVATENEARTRAIFEVGRNFLDVFDEGKNRKLQFRSKEVNKIIQA